MNDDIPASHPSLMIYILNLLNVLQLEQCDAFNMR